MQKKILNCFSLSKNSSKKHFDFGRLYTIGSPFLSEFRTVPYRNRPSIVLKNSAPFERIQCQKCDFMQETLKFDVTVCFALSEILAFYFDKKWLFSLILCYFLDSYDSCGQLRYDTVRDARKFGKKRTPYYIAAKEVFWENLFCYDIPLP